MTPLKIVYTYHPPTEVTKPLHEEVVKAYEEARANIEANFSAASEAQSTSPLLFEKTSNDLYRMAQKMMWLSDRINHPFCLDLYNESQTALMLSRMWANKYLATRNSRYLALFRTSIEESEMWMNAAIANNGPLVEYARAEDEAVAQAETETEALAHEQYNSQPD